MARSRSEKVRDWCANVITVPTREETEVKKWSDHPFAQRAARLADEAGDLSTLGVLEKLLDVMYEVEDRFPGVPFSEILVDQAQTPGYDLARVRRTLQRNGACPADIALVAPSSEELRPRRDALKQDPYAENAERL